jgi:hypothetical protein
MIGDIKENCRYEACQSCLYLCAPIFKSEKCPCKDCLVYPNCSEICYERIKFFNEYQKTLFKKSV